MRRLLLISLLVCALMSEVSAQSAFKSDFTEEEWLSLILNDIFTALTEEDEEVDVESIEADLMTLRENPINLNTATQADLERLPFLNPNQIDDILQLVGKKPLTSLSELSRIRSLHSYDIRDMEPFVCVLPVEKFKPFYLKELLHSGKNEVGLRFDARNIEQNGKDPYYGSVRYNFSSQSRLSFGLIMERDVAEPLYAKGKIYGADYYGGYLQINKLWRFSRIVVGDFRTRFGLGLVANSSATFNSRLSLLRGKSFLSEGVRRKNSSSEANYQRGIGATYNIKQWSITAFYSARKIDADTLSGCFPNIITTGYHRTETEISHKRTVWQQYFGGNITYNFKRGRVGITATEMLLSDTLKPKLNYYNVNYFSGTRQAAIGVNTYYKFNRIELFGEVATAQSHRWGFGGIGGMRFTPMSDICLVVLGRYYSPYYDNLQAYAIGEDKRNNAESGVLIGASVDTEHQVKIRSFIDIFHFSQAKYGCKQPSEGVAADIIVDYYANNSLYMQGTFRAKYKYEKGLYSLRYRLDKSVGNLLFRTMIFGNICHFNKQTTYGAMLSQYVDYHIARVPIVLQLCFGAFYAPSYDNRFYYYESDVLYNYSMPSLYGLGIRYAFNFRYTINKIFALYLKVSQTIYNNEWTHSQQLKSPYKTEVHSVLRVTI